jgi:hypothetical protein
MEKGNMSAKDANVVTARNLSTSDPGNFLSMITRVVSQVTQTSHLIGDEQDDVFQEGCCAFVE